MESLALAVLILLGAIAGGVVAFAIARRSAPAPQTSAPTEIALLQNQIQEMQRQVSSQVNQVMGMVNDRLKESTQVSQQTQQNMNERLDKAAKVFGDIQNKLGQVEVASKQIFDVGKDISSLQDMLRAPKFRGGMGEFLLGEVLKQILPPEYIQLQYKFKSGEAVDAVIKFKDGLVAIDSKFPLENFKRMVETADENARRAAERIFVQDVKKHIDAISKKYILPDEGTFNFAFMYVPAENVYYETIIKDTKLGEDKSILQYALDRRVHPVSPNSFYAYLQTVLYGLKGMQIEKRAQELWSHLSGLTGEFNRVVETFQVLGGHLTNAAAKYNEVEKRLDKFATKLEVAELDPAQNAEQRERAALTQ